jgi:ABC-type transport system substrate-binding protein
MASPAFQLLIASSFLNGFASASAHVSTATCTQHTIDFVGLAGDSTLAAIEDDIAADLAKVGITLNKRFVAKDIKNTAMTSGDFHMVYSETWGPPYDPFSYATGWRANDEAHYSAMAGLTGDNARDKIFDQVTKCQNEIDEAKLAVEWEKLHQMVHSSAIHVPLWGKKIPSVLNERLSGYTPGYQQFDYPISTIKVLSGSKTVTISPGAQTGLFKTVGPMNPHVYRPNEFFSNNLIYEGLVAYGPGGSIVPSLATSWTESADGLTFTFTLRTGVKFHDGEDWNCAAAKMNFDHFFAKPFTNTDGHGWYELPLVFESASCDADGKLVLTTSRKYCNVLRELTFIRPTRLLSRLGFHSDAADAWQTHNSCKSGTQTTPAGVTPVVTVTCAGLNLPVGTGPFKYVSRTRDTSCTSDDPNNGDGEYCDSEVVFARNDEYWGGAPDIETLKFVRYPTAAAVAAALTDGSLDAVIGGGVLEPADLKAFMANNQFTTSFTDVLTSEMIIINSGQAPTDDIEVRRTIIHAINKAAIIQKELDPDVTTASDRMFPRTTPYSDVELTPRWDYDFEKAVKLNCAASLQKEEKMKADLGAEGATIDELTKERDALKVQLEDLQKDTTDDTASSASVLGLAACAITYFF